MVLTILDQSAIPKFKWGSDLKAVNFLCCTLLTTYSGTVNYVISPLTKEERNKSDNMVDISFLVFFANSISLFLPDAAT